MLYIASQVMDKVEVDLDLQEETIISRAEMRGYLNDALRDCRSFLFKLDPDYFLDSAPMALTMNQELFDLPTGCYAAKIRAIIYDNGSLQYRIRKISELHKFERIHELDADQGSDPQYRYTVKRPIAGAEFKIKLSPPSREISDENITVWFTREVTLIEDGDEAGDIDIPEHIDYIYAHMKRSCKTKLNNNVTPPDADQAVEDQKALIVEALEGMDAESDNEVPPDFSFYDDHS